MTENLPALERMIWCDLETFGLDPQVHPILEIGFRITDLDLNPVSEASWLVWERDYPLVLSEVTDPFVRDMHTKSDLLWDAEQWGSNLRDTNESVIDWLADNGVMGEPLCGSSVHFDRAMLAHHFPGVVSKSFSHRNIDVSSLKELCMRFDPETYALMDKMLAPKKAHRVLSDLDDTINEFEFYLSTMEFPR